MKKFTILFNSSNISVETGNHYRVSFPGGQWMIIEKYPDDSHTTPVENENISYSTAFVWVVEDASSMPAPLSNEDLQTLGELIRKKEQELENN